MSAEPAETEGYMAINRHILTEAFDYYRTKYASNNITLIDFLNKALHVHDEHLCDSWGFNDIDELEIKDQYMIFRFDGTGRDTWEHVMQHFLTDDGFDRHYFANHNEACECKILDDSDNDYVVMCNHHNSAENSLRLSCLLHSEIKTPIYQLYQENCSMNDYVYSVFSEFSIDLPDIKFKEHDLDYCNIMEYDHYNLPKISVDNLINHIKKGKNTNETN